MALSWLEGSGVLGLGLGFREGALFQGMLRVWGFGAWELSSSTGLVLLVDIYIYIYIYIIIL